MFLNSLSKKQKTLFMELAIKAAEANGVVELAEKNMLQFLTMEVFPRWKRYLIENQPVIIPDTAELKSEYPDEYDFFTKYGVRSLLCAPYSKRINQGYVGVDNPTRFQDDPTFLFIVCYAVVLELNEIKMQQTVDAAERRASHYNDNEVYVNTFGGLEITNHKGTLSDDDIKSDQCYDFLCFLLLNHKRRFPIDRLYDIVRPADVNMDASPYTVVKNVVYRIRKTLSIINLEDLIVGKSGTFVINPEMNINADFDRMEDACQRLADTTDSEMMLSHFKAITEIYRGSLLPRASGQLWLVPIATYYQSLYMRVLKGYILRKLHIPTLPASVLALSDIPFAVCSSLWHGISPFRNEQYRNQGNKATGKRNRYQKVIICAPP